MWNYYKFTGVDNDRYTVNGEYRQVMLAREISYPLPSRTWVNEHLAYTHGYGVVLGRKLLTRGASGILHQGYSPSRQRRSRSEAEIYFGENSNEYVFVRPRCGVRLPVGDKNVYSAMKERGRPSPS